VGLGGAEPRANSFFLYFFNNYNFHFFLRYFQIVHGKEHSACHSDISTSPLCRPPHPTSLVVYRIFNSLHSSPLPLPLLRISSPPPVTRGLAYWSGTQLQENWGCFLFPLERCFVSPLPVGAVFHSRMCNFSTGTWLSLFFFFRGILVLYVQCTFTLVHLLPIIRDVCFIWIVASPLAVT